MDRQTLFLCLTLLSIACTCRVLSGTQEQGWLYSNQRLQGGEQGGDVDGDYEDDLVQDDDDESFASNVYKLQQKIILSKSAKWKEDRKSSKNYIKHIDVESFDWRNNLDVLKELNGGALTFERLDAIEKKMNGQLDLAGISRSRGLKMATEADRKRIVAKILSEPVSKAIRSNGEDIQADVDDDSEQDPDYEESDYNDEDESDEDEDNDEEENEDEEWDDDEENELSEKRKGSEGSGGGNQKGTMERADSMEYIFDEQDKKNKQQSDKESIDIIEHEIDEKNLEPRKKKFFDLEDEEVEYNMNNIKLIVYGKGNKDSVKFLAEPSIDSILDCNIDFTGKVAAVSHGFWNSAESENMVLLRREVMKLFDVAIFIDWSPYGQFWMYKTSARSTRVFGEILGQFLVDLHQHKGLKYDQLHMMGYSLGAHIVAFASRTIAAKEMGVKPKRLTAFDPALPLIADAKGVRLTDAEIVQVIHTNAGFFGQTEKRGHIDFYPNGGNNQPECVSESALTMKSQSCDHGRAIMLFISSMKDSTDGKEHECEFVGYPCNSYNDYLLGQCSECDRGPEEQCRTILHESQPVDGVERIKSLYLVGGVPGALCAPNYHVELDYWPDVDLAERSPGPDQSPLMIRFRTRSGHILKASFDMSMERPKALLVDHGIPTKIKNGRISLKSYHNLIRSMKVTYLSHTNHKVIEKYSVTLCFYKNSAVRGELFVISKKKSCWHNDKNKLERQHSIHKTSSLVGTPFYKQAKYGLPPSNGIPNRL